MAVMLFQEKENCCGCGACMNACPRDAITMAEDECGFVYPRIDPLRCIECGACLNACGYQNLPNRTKPSRCFAAAARNDELRSRSSSGGVFAVLASRMIGRSGVVYGVAMPMETDGFYPKHVRIDCLKDLSLLQGSKYVQSDTSFTFRQVREDLQNGREVLYSGTPCQIAGLLKYLGRSYENLLTVEVICHGVPGRKLFRDFVSVMEKKVGKQMASFSFRQKGRKNGKYVSITFCGTERMISPAFRYSYMYFFQDASLSRESCHACPFACGQRVADITVGDYWGFHEEHPEISAGTRLGDGKGISCVLVNTEKGHQAVQEIEKSLEMIETQFEKIARHNEQLCHPCGYHPERDNLLRMYREGGYKMLENHFWQAYRKERFVKHAISMVPQSIRRTARRVIGILKTAVFQRAK